MNVNVKEKMTVLSDMRVMRDLQSELLLGQSSSSSRRVCDSDSAAVRKVKQLTDLLDRMLALDSEKRISISDALHHPFFKDSDTHTHSHTK